MADHLKPTITSTYSDFVTEMDARFDDLAVGLDPAVTTATNVFTNSIRWSSASNKWQKYNGTAWNDLSALYSINISGNAATVTNGIYSNGAYADPSWITSLSGSKITGDIAGNASTATVLATARNINGVAFNGSAAISINLNNSVTFNNAGTGSASGITFNGSAARTISYNTIGAPSTTGTNASGSWAISVTGSSASWTTPRTLTIGATGKSLDGSANVTWSLTEVLPTTTDLSVASLTASGNVTAYSDARLKTDLSKIKDAVNKVKSLTGYTFTRIDTNERQMGLLAQDVLAVAPEVIRDGEYLSVAYGNLIALVVEAIKDIDDRLTILEGKQHDITSNTR